MILKLYPNPSTAATCKRCRGKITDEYRTRCGGGWMHVRCAAAARCNPGRAKNNVKRILNGIQMLSKDGVLLEDEDLIIEKLIELSRKGDKCKTEAEKIKMLIQKASSNIPTISTTRTGTINTVSSNEHFKEGKLENLAQMVARVMGNNPSMQMESMTQFRRLLSIKKPPIQKVIDAHVVPRFVEFLSRDDKPALQFEATWALANIALGTSDNTKVVIEQGAVPIFVKLLSSPNDDVREQAVWALGNIAADSPPCRDLVLDAGAMEPLLRQLQTQGKLSMMRNATRALSNFCKGKPQPSFERVRIALPTLAELICHDNEEVLTNSCWALSYLSDGPNDKIQAVIEAGVCRRLVELLMNPSPAVQAPALRTVLNIVSGNDVQTQFIINHNVLPCLLSLLGSPNKGIRKDACWTISNITAGVSEQIQSVIDSNIIPPLVQLLISAEFDIRKEAAWAISNATSGGTPLQIKFLVTQGCIRPLCDLLSITDPKIVKIALEGLENILKVGEADAKTTGIQNEMATYITEADGLNRIEDLQHHSNHEIFDKCMKILETYFGVHDR